MSGLLLRALALAAVLSVSAEDLSGRQAKLRGHLLAWYGVASHVGSSHKQEAFRTWNRLCHKSFVQQKTS